MPSTCTDAISIGEARVDGGFDSHAANESCATTIEENLIEASVSAAPQRFLKCGAKRGWMARAVLISLPPNGWRCAASLVQATTRRD